MNEEFNMGDRLDGKVAIVVGAGQTAGETMGNGRATAILFAREGARVMLVDNNEASAEETAGMIREEGGECFVLGADITAEADCKRIADHCVAECGRIDVLHYNVGKSEGDGEVTRIDVEVWDGLMAMNLRGLYLTCKYVIPVMREQESGVISAVSSAAAVASGSDMTYKTSKAGVNALMQSVAVNNARYGIRANAIMPGLMDTPMAIERRAREQNVSREDIRAARDARVPLKGKMGTAWDVAYAALFLASDEAGFITGIALPVDGGSTARVG
jgi:NAD(P)-dependent dehydrogenase (short-subunit alcohol dehydrogenase family)